MMLIYILINVFDLGLSGVIGAVAVANLCASLFLFYKSGLAQYISFEFISIDLTRQMIAYAWPLIPNNLSSWVMTLSDRLLLSMFLGVEVNAVYAVAKKIPNLLTAVQSTFSLAWQENASLSVEDSDIDSYYSRMFSLVFDLVIGSCAVLIGISPLLFALLIRGDYMEAYCQMPILFIALTFTTLSSYLAGIYIADKRTKAIGITTTIAATINLGIDLILIGLFSGSYNNLDFNVHLWFLPCFFVTVVLFNILVNLGGRKTAYIVSALMSLIYVILSMPELLWGFNRVFKYIGFYAVGVSLAGRETKIADRKIGTGVTAVVLLTVNFILSLYNLTTGIMWFVTALIGVAAVILISQFINENRILQYFGRISLIVLCIHGPVYRVVVKIISIPLHMGTDAVREKFLLAMLVMIVTMVICSLAYEIIVRVAPWMIGKKKVKVL